MAQGNYDYATLLLVIQHALGKPLDAQLTTALDVMNDALYEMAMAYPWGWRHTVFSAANTSGDVTLPADFGGMIFLHEAPLLAAANGGSVSMVNEILPLRAGLSQDKHVSTYRYSLSSTTGGDTNPSVPTLKLWPAPVANHSPCVQGTYLRVPQAFDADSGDEPDIPIHFMRLYKQLLRYHALAEDHNPAAVVERENYLRLLEDYKAVDAAGLSGTAFGVVEGRGLARSQAQSGRAA